ncbi:SDR family oxidoreductase [Microlunatus flavus]|uniref:NAD(P)-dependent dehydrogenase, short-chain alcohol dehydrogenase family n=1 Tax=Microlunatus flavus TaxID=1036181 RepID=A0A1H9CF46_9ACTN|nr:SDR family oxidoreductase [Microlunatus flavus]SEP99816.1 NAD(P)-dependent dehydrogenase, short-chain alcohol dehydrogenase family [Microlunatus flavus]
MDLHLDGRIAVVTGASKGIGLAVTRRLVEEGATVVAGARHQGADLPGLVAGGRVHFVPVDLSTPEGPTALAEAAAALGGIDVLVNNAGAVSPRPGGFGSVGDDDWQATLTLTLMAAVRMVRAAVPQLRRRGGGSVVTISSVNAFLADPLVVDYSAAKAALTNLGKSLSKELGAEGIRVNTVSPGPVATDLWLGAGGVAETVGRSHGASAGDVAAQAAAQGVTGRFTRPEEVADLVAVLASDRLGNVTGADVVIDGGLTPTV